MGLLKITYGESGPITIHFSVFFLAFHQAITALIFSNISLIPHLPVEKVPEKWGKTGSKLPYHGVVITGTGKMYTRYFAKKNLPVFLSPKKMKLEKCILDISR